MIPLPGVTNPLSRPHLTYWFSEEHFWLAFRPAIRPPHLGLLSCLDINRRTIQLDKSVKTDQAGGTVVTWRLLSAQRHQWDSITNMAYEIHKRLANSTSLLPSTRIPPAPSDSGYHREYHSAEEARTAILRSRDAITNVLTFISFMLCITPGWRTMVLGHVPPVCADLLQSTWVADPSLQRVGALVEVSTVPPWFWNCLRSLCSWPGLPLFLCWDVIPRSLGRDHPSEPYRPDASAVDLHIQKYYEAQRQITEPPPKPCQPPVPPAGSRQLQGEEPLAFFERTHASFLQKLHDAPLDRREAWRRMLRDASSSDSPPRRKAIPRVGVWEWDEDRGADDEWYAVRKVVGSKRWHELWRETENYQRVFNPIAHEWDIWKDMPKDHRYFHLEDDAAEEIPQQTDNEFANSNALQFAVDFDDDDPPVREDNEHSGPTADEPMSVDQPPSAIPSTHRRSRERSRSIPRSGPRTPGQSRSPSPPARDPRFWEELATYYDIPVPDQGLPIRPILENLRSRFGIILRSDYEDASAAPRYLYRIASYDKDREVIPEEYFSAVKSFFKALMQKDAPPPALWDLSAATPPAFLTQGHLRVRCAELTDPNVPGLPQKVFIVVKAAGPSSDPKLVVESATTAVQILRSGWGPNFTQVLLRLCERGIPFRVLDWKPPLDLAPAQLLRMQPPSATVLSQLWWRGDDWKATWRDYLLYQEARDLYIRQYPHCRAALRRGGILWRLAMESLLPDSLYDQFEPVESTMSPVALDGEEFVEQTLSEAEIDFLIGTYKIQSSESLV